MDLKNIDFKNINFEDIKAKLLAIDKKTLIKIGIAAGSVIFFLIIYYAILNPIVNKKKIQLDDLNTKLLLKIVNQFEIQVFMTGTKKDLFSFLSTSSNAFLTFGKFNMSSNFFVI